MTVASERRTVQNPFLRYAQEAGWTYLPPEEAMRLRGGEDSPFLRAVLVERLQRLNPGVITSPTKAEEVIERLRRVRPNIEGNLEAWEYLKGLKTVFVEAERREKNVRLLDPDHPEANALHVTDEFRFAVGSNAIRADIVLLVNGIPVILVETKAATHVEGIAEAFDQIRRYHEQAPELLCRRNSSPSPTWCSSTTARPGTSRANPSSTGGMNVMNRGARRCLAPTRTWLNRSSPRAASCVCSRTTSYFPAKTGNSPKPSCALIRCAP